ncbi:MAG: exo-alpha-sialidase [Bacteroidales bacterium]|nr:exo-alpha-sialidase [Bacteroidales bacterium]
MKKICLALFVVFCCCGSTVFAQTPAAIPDSSNYPYWIKMMQDPDANFFSTVSAFEAYWKNRPVTKGCGWKPFKRWEYIMQGRISPDGKKPDAAKSVRAFQSYSGNNRSVSGTWVSMGPSTIPSPGPAGYEGLGRLNVVAFHPTNANKIYVGAPSGGFWMSDNNGLNWTTTTDQLPSIGVSSIIVDYSNVNKILIGTGDRDHGDAPGIGVYKSLDGGLTWSSSNNGMGDVNVNKIIQHPTSSMVFLAATNYGIFRSVDGGSNWTLTYSGNYSDLCFKPGDASIVYAESRANFYRSTNNGQGFVQITSGLPSGQRGSIAVSAANPAVVYFLQSNNDSGFQGLFKSTDSGLNFNTQSTYPNILDWSCDGSGTGGQGWYDLSIAADPTNANTLYVGGVDVWKSTDGGVNWVINSHWYGGCSVPAVHADCHYLGFSPVTGRLYAGNDGGIYYSDNGGVNWTDCTVTMAIGQIYKIGQSQTNASKTINGFQDNGTYTLQSTGWVATGGGDGMECAVDYSNEAYMYHTIYFGDIFRTYNNGSEQHIAGNGAYGIDESGGWVTPFILSENNPKKMFVGYKDVWRSDDATIGTPVWTKISSGEVEDCSVLEQSPANVDILYVVHWGTLKRSDNANASTPSWVSCTLPGGNTPTDIEAHPTDPNIVYATAGYNVYKSNNKGVSWSLVPGTLPGIPINTLVYDKNSSEGLYIGTQTGVLFKNSSLPDWILFTSDFLW